MIGILERFGPFSLAIVSVVTMYVFKADVMTMARAKDVDFSNLYSSIFDWSSIQTGFLFAIFGFVAGKTDGFISRIKNTPEMRLFLLYTKRALFLGFAITISSVPLTVTSFDVSAAGAWRYHVLCAWLFLSTWGFFSFLRVAYIFGDLLKVKDVEKFVG